VSGGFVKFDYGSVNGGLVKRSITPGDVIWASRLLARISNTQWRDAFRAGGYDASVTARFVRRIQEKIAEGMLP
jgi:hypothetical protein